jgi:hypothetical protein
VKALRRKVAARTTNELRGAIRGAFPAFSPVGCANDFTGTGYDP